MKYVFWSIIAAFLLVEGILYIREGHSNPFLERVALERTALIVKPKKAITLHSNRISFEGEWGQGKRRTYLFLVTDSRIVRGEGALSRIGLLSMREGSIEKFEIMEQDMADSALDYHIEPPSLLRGIASTLTFDSLTWFHRGEVRNYFAKTLSSHAFEEVPDYILTIPEEEFKKQIIPLKESAPRTLTRTEFQTLQDLVHKNLEEMPRNLISYDMTFPEKIRELKEDQTVTESTTPDGKKKIIITATQSSPEPFTNFVRIYLPYVTSVSTKSPYFLKPRIPHVPNNSFVSHPLIVALEDSMVFDSKTNLYTYDEGEYTVIGGFVRVGPTPKTFSITVIQDP